MFKHKEKGQSLIELTFFLIILLILIAGIVEVGAILQTKLAVVNSAREGARFGTQSASDEDITMVTDAATANVINYSSDNADIWVIRAKTDEDGDIGDTCVPVNEREAAETYWCLEHTMGDGPAMPDFVTKDDIEVSLKGVASTEVVGVAVAYDHQSIIGLPYAVGGGGMPVTSYTVMRIERTEELAGCLIWPLAVHEDTVNWPDGFPRGTDLPDIYDGNAGTLGWLRWNEDGSAGALINRLQNPSSSTSEYTNPADEDDHFLDVGDWVWGDTGVSNANDVRNALNTALQEGKHIRILVYGRVGGIAPTDETPGECNGYNCSYEIVGFVTIKLKDLNGNGKVFEVDGANKRIEAEFVSFDYDC
jgi:hypothetical protein